MSVLNQIAAGAVVESVEPEFVSESDMATLLAFALEEVCNDEEIEELKESADSGAVVFTPVEERSIVKLDKKAKKQQTYKVALYQVAKENNDPNYDKLVTLWKAERELEARLEKRWHSKAVSRMKQMANEASKSKSNAVKKIASKGDGLTRSQKMTQKALKGVPKDVKNNAKANNIVKKLGMA